MKNAGEDLVKSEKYDDAIYVFEAIDESEKNGYYQYAKGIKNLNNNKTSDAKKF